MTITYTHYVEPLLGADATNGKRSPKPPPRIWQTIDPPFKGYQPAPSEAYQQSSRDTAVVIDNGMHRPFVEQLKSCGNSLEGSSLVRAGWSFDATPRLSFPPDVARYRDRKYNRTVSYVGYDAYADATTRGQIRNAFEPGTSIVGNWDAMEGILDHIFVSLGIDNDGSIDRSVLMTETIANLSYTRKSRFLSLLIGAVSLLMYFSYE